jgi:hypothetical protein
MKALNDGIHLYTFKVVILHFSGAELNLNQVAYLFSDND